MQHTASPAKRGYGFQIELWGDYACFTRPELKAERVSYPVPTPSALEGLLASIYWHPGVKYHISKIHVLSPIQFTTSKRNELKSVIAASGALSALRNGNPMAIYSTEDRQQRTSLLLQDVHYVIETYVTVDDNDKAHTDKVLNIMARRLETGQCFSQPYFGCREFAAHFRPWPGGPIPAYPITQDLGFMLYDLNYSDPENITPRFFRAKLVNGVLEVPDEGGVIA